MSYKLFSKVVDDLANARMAEDYIAAKRLAEGLGLREQFMVFDHLIKCRRRLVEMGVL